MSIKRKIAGLVAILMIVAMAGCSSIEQAVGETPVPQATQATESAAPAVSAAPLATPLPEDTTLYATVEGNRQVLGDEFRYYFMNIKADYEYSVEDPTTMFSSNPDLLDEIKQQVIEYCIQAVAVEKLAAAAGISLTDEDRATVEQDVANTIEQMGGEEAYQSALAESFLTDSLYRRLLEQDALRAKWSAALFATGGELYTTDEEFKAFINENYIRATHVLIGLDAEGETTQQALAQEVLQKAKAGEDFDSLIAEYGEDYGVTDNPDGYYFTHGFMVEPFEQAAYALQEGQISEIITSEYGYHIIKRMPMEQTYIDENLAALRETYQNFIVNSRMTETMDAVTDITYTDAFNAVNENSFK